ncbi:CaiB/BaiF CoA transferase family protein [Blastococcus sp. SYSU DS0539]
MSEPTAAGPAPADGPGTRPFTGLTVLDVSQGMAGPRCTQILAEQGARVIKVEPPHGDWARTMGRTLGGATAIFASSNAGKESVVLDTRTAAGRAALTELAARCDVVVESFRPGVAARMGLDHRHLADRRPDLVYVSIDGFGSAGPLAGVPAVDTVLQAAGGLMQANRDAAGTPRRVGFYVVDLTAASHAAGQVAAALYGVARTGRGRRIEVTLLQAAASLVSYLVLDEAMFPDDDLFAAGEVRSFAAPSGVFETADGHLYVGALTDVMFTRLAGALRFDDWLADEELATNVGRLRRREDLHARLAETLAHRTADEWELALASSDVLISKVRTPDDVRTHPQARHTGLFAELDHAGRPLPWPGLPGGGDFQPAPGPVPALGEHTDAVLAEFGLRGPAPS